MDKDTFLEENLGKSISTRILDSIRAEVIKSETREKLKCITDPFVFYLLEVFQPYVITLVVIMIVMLICQGYLIQKLIHVQNSIISMT